MIPWAWWKDHDYIYSNLLQVWHGEAARRFLPQSLMRFGSWDNACGAALEQVWAIREGLADKPEGGRDVPEKD